MKIKATDKVELTADRKELINKYLSLQTDYQALYNKCLVNKITITREQEELDIDKLDAKQMNLLDSIVTDEQREEALKDLPHHMVDYEAYLVAPFYIGDSSQKKDVCVSQLETELIELIIGGIEDEIKDYKVFLK